MKEVNLECNRKSAHELDCVTFSVSNFPLIRSPENLTAPSSGSLLASDFSTYSQFIELWFERGREKYGYLPSNHLFYISVISAFNPKSLFITGI